LIPAARNVIFSGNNHVNSFSEFEEENLEGGGSMSNPLSAVDCVSPAIAQTKRQLFAPFRWARWWRLAVICLLTGEFAGGGGGGVPANFNSSNTHGKGDDSLLAMRHVPWNDIFHWLPWILVGAVLLFALIFLFVYIASVFRFVLFDSVLNDRCQFKGSWTRWEPCGRSFFYWCLVFFAVCLLGTGLLMGVPALVAWRTGLFDHPGEHLAVLILGGLTFLFILLVFVVVTAVISLFAKDFCIPIMAMENVGILEAWRRLRPMLAAEKLPFAGYVLMKIVLAIANAIIVGIVTILTFLFLLIPMGIAGLIMFFGGKALGLTFNLATISILVVLGGIIVMGLIYLVALINTPPMVFFQSYTLHFIGSRYPAVGQVLFPPPPETPPTLDAPTIPEPSIG
jgi:hypothetical protein